MDSSFEKRVKEKKRKRIAAAILVVVIAAVILFTFKIQGTGEGSGGLFGLGERSVTVEIRCDALSQDLSKLSKPELEKYIPEDGVILEETKCTIEEGETVFDVVDRVCREKNIQIEYSYTPGYDSYYVEGINYLYEKDGGKTSGWTYTVNGETPSYGCSQYKLSGGEKIQWEFVLDY